MGVSVCLLLAGLVSLMSLGQFSSRSVYLYFALSFGDAALLA